ncbi:ROK family protein [Paucibacter soli]|uniref:ROK family protein n=1 Tax=Paucibacter soli TaxID=3133433 RepID=UPI00309CDA6A
MPSTEAAQACCGIDIGGSKIELVAYAVQGQVLTERHRRRIATPGQDFDAFCQAIKAMVLEADGVLGEPCRVGLGLPGVIDAASGCHLSSNVPALNGQRVVPAMQALLQRPVRIGNDCQCFALSEARGGAADGLPSMFGVILGTGAGGGYCANGRLLAGYNGMAGEWGHQSLPAHLLERHRLPLLDCPCGLRGCLERYVSGSGLEALYRHLGGEPLDTAQVAARAAAGEARARRCLEIHLDVLAHGLAQLMLGLDPHAFVLGGGLSKLAHLYTELPAAMARHLFKGVRVPPILPPHFGDAGGARGAALLALQAR